MDSKNMQYAFQVEYPNAAVRGAEPSQLNQDLLSIFRQDEDNTVLKDGLAYSRKRVEKLEKAGASTVYMRTVYPGLLMGTGYPHMTGKMEGEIQIGFSFDSITGLPYYPGSSLKGMLRHVFDAALAADDAAPSYIEYLQEKFAKENVEATVDVAFLRAYTDSCFSGIDPDTGEAAPILERDVYYDSYPVGFWNGHEPETFMDIDNITPHLDMDQNPPIPAPLKDPIPLTQLRVMPGTCFAFVFHLTDFLMDGSIAVTPEQKAGIYRDILTDFGIGAKTHVGYGNMKEIRKKQQIVAWLHGREQPAEQEEKAPVHTKNLSMTEKLAMLQAMMNNR